MPYNNYKNNGTTDRSNKASVWANDKALQGYSPKGAPILKMKVNVDGTEKEVSLWLNVKDVDNSAISSLLSVLSYLQEQSGKKPILTGKVSDPYKKDSGGGGTQYGKAESYKKPYNPPVNPATDNGIPF